MTLYAADLLWIAACACAVLLSLPKSVGRPGLWVALTLTASCLVTIALEHFVGQPHDLYFYPLLDAASGILIFHLWRQKPLFTRGLIVVLITMQCALHVLFWYRADLSLNNQNAYIACLNVTFAVQLLAAAYPGVTDACVRLLGPFGPPRRHRHRVGPYSAGRSGR